MFIIFVILIIFIALAYNYGKTKTEDNYKRREEENRIRKITALKVQKLANYDMVAGGKNYNDVLLLVEKIKGKYSSEIIIEKELEGVLTEFTLYIKFINKEKSEIRKYIEFYLNDIGYGKELYLWIYPGADDIEKYKTVRSFNKEASAYIAREMLRRFLNVESIVVKENYSNGPDPFDKFVSWAVEVNPKYDNDILRQKYNDNFEEWIKIFNKDDPNIVKLS